MQRTLRNTILLLIIACVLAVSIGGCASQINKPIDGLLETDLPISTTESTSQINKPIDGLLETDLPISTTESISHSTENALYQSGPWLIFVDGGRLFAVNKDGTGLTALVPDYSVWQAESSPTEDIVAVLGWNGGNLSGSILLLDIPTGRILQQIPLFSFYDNSSVSFDDGARGPSGGILGGGPTSAIKWSPDGRYLAFMGAIENPSSSLYIYDCESRSIKLLSKSNYQAVNPNWSPDGKWIVYEDVISFHGWKTDGIWAASVDGRESKLLYKSIDEIDLFVIDWVDNDIVIFAENRIAERNIRMADVTTGTITDLFLGYFSNATISNTGSVIILPTSGAPGAGFELERGLYLVSPKISDPMLIVELGAVFIEPKLVWETQIELFVSDIQCDNEPEKILAFDSTGNKQCITKTRNDISPNGAWFIDQNEIYQANGEKMGVLAGTNKQIIWCPNSEGFFSLIDVGLQYTSLPNMISKSVYEFEPPRYFHFSWVGSL